LFFSRGPPMALKAQGFPPGDRITMPPAISTTLAAAPPPITVSPISHPPAYVASVPARIGLCVRNMATFGPGKAGGGGIGFSVDVFSRTYCAVRLLPSGAEGQDVVVSACGRERVLRHQLAVVRAALAAVKCGPWEHVRFTAHIVHESDLPAHSGLGSTSGAALGALFGLNAALGSPLSGENLRQLLACNYVEEFGASEVCFGYESTMSATGALGGGVYVIHDTTMEVLARNCDAFRGCPVLIFLPTSAAAAEVDEDTVLSEGSGLDSAAAEAAKKDRLFDEVLVPELRRGKDCDHAAVTAAVRALQGSGGKRAEVRHQPHGPAILRFIDEIHARIPEAVLVGMSSVGPAVALACRGNHDDATLAEIARTGAMREVFRTTLNTSGVSVATVPPPVLVAVVGPPFAGKTAVCEAVATADSTWRHFAAGAYLRRFVADPPPTQAAEAAEIRDIMLRGEVDDRGHVTTLVLAEELLRRIVREGPMVRWLLDGFPRTALGLDLALDRFGLPISAVLHIAADPLARKAREAVRPKRAAEPGLQVRDELDATGELVACFRRRGIPIHEVANNGDIPLDAALAALPK
jgi:adenylate kinase family enzyme/predicted sugar kinase